MICDCLRIVNDVVYLSLLSFPGGIWRIRVSIHGRVLEGCPII